MFRVSKVAHHANMGIEPPLLQLDGGLNMKVCVCVCVSQLCVCVSQVCCSDLGIQHLQQQFVHGHASRQVEATEGVDGRLGGLAEQGEGHQQTPRPVGLRRPMGDLVVLQGLVEVVLETLHRLGTLQALCI